MSKIRQTYEQIIKYLSDLLSDRERHELERTMMNDPFDAEAFEGLSQLTAGELDADVDSLENRLDTRIRNRRKVRMISFWRIAAALAILVGIGALLYNLLRAPAPELITRQESRQEKTQPAETAIPTVPESVPEKKPSELSKRNAQGGDDIKSAAESSVTDDQVFAIDEIVSNQTSESRLEYAAQEELPAAAAKTAEPEQLTLDTSGQEYGYISGRVLGINRKALSGVSITEEGTSQATSTDMNGNFRLKVSDPRSKLELSYTGYKDMEVASKEIAGKEITLDEELIAQKDVEVLNYNNVKLNRSAARTAESKSNEKSAEIYRRPVPPGGSMKNFEVWVESRIDTVRLKELLPGKYKISVKLKVHKDGTISDINVPNDVPDIAAEEYRHSVSLSERWQPAMADNLPVDADVMIEFSLTIK